MSTQENPLEEFAERINGAVHEAYSSNVPAFMIVGVLQESVIRVINETINQENLVKLMNQMAKNSEVDVPENANIMKSSPSAKPKKIKVSPKPEIIEEAVEDDEIESNDPPPQNPNDTIDPEEPILDIKMPEKPEPKQKKEVKHREKTSLDIEKSKFFKEFFRQEKENGIDHRQAMKDVHVAWKKYREEKGMQ